MRCQAIQSVKEIISTQALLYLDILKAVTIQTGKVVPKIQVLVDLISVPDDACVDSGSWLPILDTLDSTHLSVRSPYQQSLNQTLQIDDS